MPEKKNNSNPPGMCQRLFHFFVNSLVARGFKRTTLGQPFPQAGSTKPPLDDSFSPAKLSGELMLNFKDHENSDHDPGSEIQVLFKQSEGMESWPSVDKFADQSPVHKDNTILDQLLRKPKEKGNTVREQLQGKSSQVVEPNSTTVARSRGPEKMVSIIYTTEEQKNKMKGKSREPKESEEEDKSKINGKSMPSENSRLTMPNEGPKMTPRRIRPLLSVAPNINEKSDAFIKSRKEAMNRNLSMEPKRS